LTFFQNFQKIKPKNLTNFFGQIISLQGKLAMREKKTGGALCPAGLNFI
tara:strand:+ start:356 stop:502 length:147 start_codon:yes stop_codon:yes gene_type:complete